jgi:predicted DNA-binding protein (MmcQ/YjbR family)
MNEKDSHKRFEEVTHELDVFERLRKSDCISIAGGEPLLYPHIVELVAEIKRRGFKPIINSNGKSLTRELLKDLHKAGVFGFTFHIDSNQGRIGKWEGKNELELNDLRLEYAQMLAEFKNIACSFNSTVYAENLEYLPGMIEWAQKHIDIVHTMVFICFRHVIPDMPFDWYAGGRKIEWDKIWYHSDSKRRIDLKSTDLVAKVREICPEFSPAAYLNGTEEPDAFKWLLAERIGTKDKIFGYVGPKFIELMMSAYHFKKDKYISYSSPKTMQAGKAATLLLWPFDKGVRKTAKAYLGQLLKNPFKIFEKLHMQSIMFIQPVDCLSDGRQSMCDGCPDITVHEDNLVWSCRLEELRNFGTFLRTVPKKEEATSV